MIKSVFFIFVIFAYASFSYGQENAPAAPKDSTEDGPFFDFGTEPVNPCLLDKDVGTKVDAEAEERWFFNKATKQCEKFDFFTGGNENNFVSKEDCEQVCNS